MRNEHYIKHPEESQKNAEARPRQTDREIHDQHKIIERIQEFYTEVHNSEQSTIIHTDPKEVPEITPWEVEAALRDMKNGTATGNDHNFYKQRYIESRRIYNFEDTC